MPGDAAAGLWDLGAASAPGEWAYLREGRASVVFARRVRRQPRGNGGKDEGGETPPPRPGAG